MVRQHLFFNLFYLVKLESCCIGGSAFAIVVPHCGNPSKWLTKNKPHFGEELPLSNYSF